MKVRIAGIKPNDIVDGVGICVSVWYQGCPHKCPGCHNPETWPENGGVEYSNEDLIKEVDSLITANGVDRNLSLLGGEPLAPYNIESALELLRAIKIKHPNIKVFLWTGYTYEELFEQFNNHLIGDILSLVDVLIEGRFILELRDISLKYRGSSNQRIFMHPHNNYPTGYLKDVTAEIDSAK